MQSDSMFCHSPNEVPIVEVAYENDMWMQLPLETSRDLLEIHWKGAKSGYTWDWGQQHGKENYILDFNTGMQRSVQAGTIRNIRVIWLHPALLTPYWTGQTIDHVSLLTRSTQGCTACSAQRPGGLKRCRSADASFASGLAL